MQNISKKDSDWLLEKLSSWGIRDVCRLLKIFNAHLVLVDKKKKLGVKKKR